MLAYKRIQKKIEAELRPFRLPQTISWNQVLLKSMHLYLHRFKSHFIVNEVGCPSVGFVRHLRFRDTSTTECDTRRYTSQIDPPDTPLAMSTRASFER
jgi:hypothetical protein